MLEFLKSAILGSRIFHRASSVEVQSKLKQSMPKKKPLSFDSKQKETRDALMTNKRQQHPEVIMHDQTATIKKYSHSKQPPSNQHNHTDFAVISDLDDACQHSQKRTSILPNAEERQGQCPQPNPQQLSSRQADIQKQCNGTPKNAMKSSILPQRNGKIYIPRDRSTMKVKRIGGKCAICDKNLACSHRCHRECGMQMQWRMRYSCDVCEVKKDHKRCSIILSQRRRTQKH